MSSRKKSRKKIHHAGHVKLSFGRHIVPPLVGLVMGLAVLGFLNSQFIAAKIVSATYKPSPIQAIPDSNVTADPNQAPKITIEDISVEAPLVFDIPQATESEFQLALRRGVAHYPSTAVPGQAGNAVFFGHSSGQVWAPGDYKFVFSLLEKLQPQDRIVVEYKGVRYFYRVTDTKVVPPTDVSVLQQSADEHVMTLITCTPVGTNKNRFIVRAEQIAPAPKDQGEAPGHVTEIDRLPDSQAPSVWDSFLSLF